MNLKPLVSIIISAFNVESYIEKCIKSICNQSYTNLEIIVVDDASTDSTTSIIEYFCCVDQRIR